MAQRHDRIAGGRLTHLCRPAEARPVALLLEQWLERSPTKRRQPMPDRKRGESRELKRDQQVRREVLDEIGSEIAQDRTPAQYRNPNRDQARGDWDRTGRHTDEGN